MDIIVETTPLNILEEKNKFFQDTSYNPQFIYRSDFDHSQLYAWGQPREDYYQHAVKMLKQYPLPHRTADEPAPLRITPPEIQQAIDDFNQTYHLAEPVKVVFSENLVSRCKVSGMSIYFHSPVRYSHSRFADLMRHELETHTLRRLNHQLQGWQEEVCPEIELRRTEEGLAGLHTYLLRDDQIYRKSFLTYIAVYVAQHGSFADVFNTLKSLTVGDTTAWSIALRTKRGLQDTAEPGGLTKDITYFEGAVQVWQWLQAEANLPQLLYIGRISLNQATEFHELVHTQGLRFPKFILDTQDYKQKIKHIGDINFFDQLES